MLYWLGLCGLVLYWLGLFCLLLYWHGLCCLVLQLWIFRRLCMQKGHYSECYIHYHMTGDIWSCLKWKALGFILKSNAPAPPQKVWFILSLIKIYMLMVKKPTHVKYHGWEVKYQWSYSLICAELKKMCQNLLKGNPWHIQYICSISHDSAMG